MIDHMQRATRTFFNATMVSFSVSSVLKGKKDQTGDFCYAQCQRKSQALPDQQEVELYQKSTLHIKR